MQGKSDPTAELLDAAAFCRHLIPENSVYSFLADHRRELFPDELFADLFRTKRGRPSVPADVIATVMVLQSLEGLSDREAAEALRRDIAWKAAAGLALDDGGIHYSVLTYWRARLRASERPERIFDAVREVISATGVLRGRHRRALDSTVLDDAVATQDTVTQLISAIRRVRRLIPEAAAVAVSGHDYDAAGKPVCAWDDPLAKEALITGLVNDALSILAALSDVDLDDDQADAVGLLALVAGQDVEPGDGHGTWRIAERVAPDRVISTVDVQTRHARKSPSNRRDGYKAHIVVEPETGLVLNSVLTPANVGDGEVAVELLAREESAEVLGDSAYGSGKLRSRLIAGGHRPTIKPIPLQPAVAGGFTRDDFVVDYEASTVTCPAAHTVRLTRRMNATFGIRCRGCPLRERCTTARDGRTLKLNTYDPELVDARRQAETPEHQQTYKQLRPMVERSISWVVAKGNRRLRYRGVARNDAWLSLRAAAINLRRLVTLGLDNHDSTWVVATP